ncbi:MAG: biotin/lipoyl-binding protein, partial [Bryobacteraceae bacterium]|nr:biotin/lipoyl-binding protein [Bryobacteraceae bacterium]
MPEIWSVIKPTMRLGLVMLALAVIASCGRRERGAEAKAAAPAVPVRVATAIVEEVPLTIEVTGSFVAEESSDLAPRVAGRVLATPVEVGDYVRRGDPVVVLDPTDQQLVVRQAEASFQQARAAVAEAQA